MTKFEMPARTTLHLACHCTCAHAHQMRISLRMRTSCLVLASDTQALLSKSRCFLFFLCFFFCWFIVILRFPLEGVKGCGLYSPGLSATSRGPRSGQRLGVTELHAVVTPGSKFDQTSWGEWSPPLNSRRSSIRCAISYR